MRRHARATPGSPRDARIAWGTARASRGVGVLAIAVATGLLAPRAAVAGSHEVPADVTVQAYVRPEGRLLTLIVRVPLASMRDVEWPLRGPGYLELEGIEPLLRDAAALWLADYIGIYEDGRRIERARVEAARVTLPSDRAFRSFDEALAHVRGGPLPPHHEIVPEQALLDVLLTAPIASAESRFSLDPGLAHLGIETRTVLHFLPPGGAERVFHYGGNPGLVRLDPRWHQAALTFTRMGFLHILEGIDHLLFILCLVLPLRRLAALVPIVTAFTVAHSITLVASALGLAPGALWFPPFIETLIAASIVYVALENIVGARLRSRWLAAFGLGLVHGFGFSFALAERLQFAGRHLLASLLAFNVGVELGQLAVLALLVPALAWIFRRAVPERIGVVIASALVAHTAWHWMTERGGQLLAYRVRLPALDAVFLADLMRWTMLALISVGAAWALAAIYGRFDPEGRRRGVEVDPGSVTG